MNLAIVSPQFRILRHGDDHLIQTQEAGEVHKVLRAIGEVDQATQATGEVHRGTQVNGDDLEMKIERSRDLQVDRIDRQKLDKVIFAQEGERPQAPDGALLDDRVGVFLRRNGEWRLVGISEAGVEQIADGQIAAAPRPARVDNVDSTVLVFNQEATIEKQYEQGNPFKSTFVFKNFATAQDREDDNELPVSERPINISFDPLTPVQLKGTHIVSVTFTPQRQGTAIAELYLE